jgi:hypothetical protein
MSPRWPWVVLALLGAYHGLNPAMGWLFALALGLQEKRRSAVAKALVPIALGHAAAIAIAILILYFFQYLFPMHSLRWPIAAIIFALGIYRLFKASHPRGAGMRVGGRDLFVWSFLMASAHGAGLMLIPVLLGRGNNIVQHDMSSPHGIDVSSKVILLSILVHTFAMLIVAGTLAIVFFELYNKVGLKVLRSTWINFDLLWAVALLVAGCTVVLK